MSSARLIREARLRARLSQAALAERLGTSQSAIARWEAGGTEPSLETLARVVRACGLELRIGLDDADPGEVSQIERNLALTPTQRLDQLVRAVEFLRAGRAALARQRRA
jgi:transcriptional regulator with XRE-family HTH domain